MVHLLFNFSGVYYTLFRWPCGQKYLLEFQFLFQAVPAEKWGCIGNYPFLQFTVAIKVRGCPVAVIQVCRPSTNERVFSYIQINPTFDIPFDVARTTLCLCFMFIHTYAFSNYHPYLYEFG